MNTFFGLDSYQEVICNLNKEKFTSSISNKIPTPEEVDIYIYIYIYIYILQD